MSLEILEFDSSTLVVRASGNVTFDESRRFQDELLGDPRLHDGVQMLVDATTMDGAPSANELRIIATEFVPLLRAGLGPIAIVCGSPFVYGVARMFTVFAEVVGARVAAFRDPTEARQWLDSLLSPVPDVAQPL